MRLQLDRARLGQRRLAVPEVFHPRAVHRQRAVEPDPGPLARLDDTQAVPFAEGLIGVLQRVLAGRARRVVPEGARALVGALLPLAAGLGCVPDLHLRRAAQIDAAVGLGDGAVFDTHLDVAVVAVGRGKGTVAVVDQLAVVDGPVLRELDGVGGTLPGTLSALIAASLAGSICGRRTSQSGRGR